MSSPGVIMHQPLGEMSGSSQQLPPSVQYLMGLDTIIVKQKVEKMEVLTGMETRNKYQILNKEEQEIFFAREQSDACQRTFCGLTRGFHINVSDNTHLPIMRFIREFKCCAGCTCCAEGCCSMEIKVESPFDTYLGRVALANSICDTHIRVFDKADNHLYTIWVPCCFCQDVCCPNDAVFPITDPSLTTEVGKMAKVFRGCCVEAIGDADCFRLEFPKSLDLDKKILLLAALFFVDYVRFEGQ